MTRFLNRLLLWKKFTILAILGLALVTVPSFLYVRDSYKNLEAARLETRGTLPAKALLQVVQLTQQDRALAALVLGGRDEKAVELRAKQQETESAYQAATALLKQAVRDPAIITAWDQALAHWKTLSGEVTNKTTSSKASTTSHTELVTSLMGVIDLVADHFGLTLDPDVDSYYLIFAALYQLPGLTEDLGRMRARGAGFLAQQKILPEERGGVAGLLEKANEHHASMAAAFAKASAGNPVLKEKLQKIADDSLAEAKQAMQLAEAQVIKPEKLTYSGTGYVNQFTRAIDTQFKLLDVVMLELDKLLQDRAAKLSGAMYTLISVVISMSLIAAWIGYLITLSITRPLQQAVGTANAIAEGNLSTQLVIDRQDEIGQLLQAMHNMIDKLSHVVSDVNSGAQALASASEQVSATAQSLSQASSEQAAGVEETSASIEQMTASIAQNTENAKVTDGMATKAAQEATEGGDAVKATVAAMNQIAKKIGIIDDIAYQTNLLALNAAIEAARAGEHGKGFAVVAAEVRKLAERSQVAAQEIGEVATNSVELAAKAGKLLDEMVPNIRKTSDLVQEITAASEEQSSGVGQINAAVSQLSQTTQQNASSSEELAATAEEMSSQAEQLQQTMSFFKLDSGHNVNISRVGQHRAASLSGSGFKPVAVLAHTTTFDPDEKQFMKF